MNLAEKTTPELCDMLVNIFYEMNSNGWTRESHVCSAQGVARQINKQVAKAGVEEVLRKKREAAAIAARERTAKEREMKLADKEEGRYFRRLVRAGAITKAHLERLKIEAETLNGWPRKSSNSVDS